MEKTRFEIEVINNYLNKGNEEIEGLTPEQIGERKELLEYYALLEIKYNQNAKNVLQQLFQKALLVVFQSLRPRHQPCLSLVS